MNKDELEAEEDKKKVRMARMEDFLAEKNTYELSLGDISWIGKNLSLDSTSILKDLLKRRFTNIDLRRFNKRRYVNAASKFLEENKSIFSKSYPGKDYFGNYFSIPVGAYEKKLSKFKEVILGFSPEDVESEKKYLPDDKRIYLKEIDRKIHENIISKEKAEKEGSKKVKEYKENIENLRKIKKRVGDVFSNPDDAARLKCNYKVKKERRMAFDLFPLKEIEVDYLFVGASTLIYSTSMVDFPLRFLTNIAARTYERLRREWSEGTTKEGLLENLETIVQSKEFFDTLANLYKANFGKIQKERLSLLEEVRDCYLGGRYASTTVLTVTQVEGILWDLASYLNKKRKFVYKKRKKAKMHYYSYLWDKKKRAYKKTNKKTGYPEFETDKYLTSARQLLEETRIVEFLPNVVVSYLVNEFLDERNQIVHGDIELLKKKTTASCALLVLYTLLDLMKDIE